MGGLIGQTAPPVITEQPKIKASSSGDKEDLERYINRAILLIHSPETRQAVLAMLGGENPVQTVADATVMVMQRIDTASRQAGIEVQDTVKMYGAHEIVNLVVEFGNAARKFKLTPDLAELALSVSVQDYVKQEVQAGRINADRLKAKMAADIRKASPKVKKEIQASQTRIQQTARKYDSGKGLSVAV